ncbi:response regulator, partial [Kineococcus glutinatus]|uniref:response regulator n=1 Tax=Kineococcus glutinatus TaxID=1070872 RepID=UPI0031E6CFEA
AASVAAVPVPAAPVRRAGAAGAIERPALRVLLAEDNLVNQKVAQLMLSKLGHRTDTVGNGREAVAAVHRNDYDVVLMDVHMPEMDGMEATRLIRSEIPRERQPRIVAVTASVLMEDRQACTSAGMDDYLSKPVRARDLEAMLTSIAAEPAVATDGVDGTDGTDGVDEPVHPPLEATVRARVEELGGVGTPEDRALFAQLLGSFVERAPQVAADLEDALAAGRAPLVEKRAHSLKGSAANLGAEELAQLSADLELRARAGTLPPPPLAPELLAALDEACRVFGTLAAEFSAGAGGPGRADDDDW